MLFSETQKKILQQLADGQFHSGTQLASVLGLSRAAISKHLKSLADIGLRHVAISGKGYRLERPLELLAQSQIETMLSPDHQALISQWHIHDSLDSTNSYLLAQTTDTTPLGIACLAEHQTAGKGRRGRQWVSPYGSNIYLSLRWRFLHGGIASTHGLSLAVGVAVMRALHQQQVPAVGLKWPNDIVSQGKKLGGILIEVSGEADGPCTAVIGIGLNLHLPAADAESISQAWTDIGKITGHSPISRNALAGSLLGHLLDITNGYENIGLKAYLDEWRQYDALQGQPATLYLGQQQLNGVVMGVDDLGLLLLKKPDGNVQAYASGEISFNQASTCTYS